MGFATNLEHIGDIIDKNLMEMCGARIKNGHALSAEGMAEITEMHGRMLENLRLATTERRMPTRGCERPPDQTGH